MNQRGFLRVLHALAASERQLHAPRPLKSETNFLASQGSPLNRSGTWLLPQTLEKPLQSILLRATKRLPCAMLCRPIMPKHLLRAVR